MRTIKFKTNKDGESVTRCPNGFTTFVGNRPKRVGRDCLFCKFRKHVDFDNHEVECMYAKKRKDKATEKHVKACRVTGGG